MRISDWSSDVCSSDLRIPGRDLRGCREAADRPPNFDNRVPRSEGLAGRLRVLYHRRRLPHVRHTDYPQELSPAARALFPRHEGRQRGPCIGGTRPGREGKCRCCWGLWRSEEHTSELQSLMRISYAVFCLKKKKEK